MLQQLTTEQFTQTVAGSYGCIRNTMVHMLSAEWGWLDRCGGTSRGPALNAADYPTLDLVIKQWQKLEGHVRQFLSTLSESDIDRVIDFAIENGPTKKMSLGQLLQHSVVHGVHHRGQLALPLRTIGSTPDNFDLIFYFEKKHEVQIR